MVETSANSSSTTPGSPIASSAGGGGGPGNGGGSGIVSTAPVSPPPRRWDQLRSFICLSLVCFSSVILVLIVAVLIALMQFQGRLVLAQPNLTAGRLIYFVGLEDAITASNQKIEAKGKELSKATLLLSKNQAELLFRMNRLCRTFSGDGSSQALVEKCQAFLSRVPFDFMPEQYDSMQKAFDLVVDTPEREENHEAAPVIPRLDKDALQKISDQFTKYMGDPEAQGQKFSEYEFLYSNDLSLIAYLNQASALTLKPRYVLARAAYIEECNYRSWISQQIRTYRDVDDIGCEGAEQKIPSIEVLTAANKPPLPAPGGDSKVASLDHAVGALSAEKAEDPQIVQPRTTTAQPLEAYTAGSKSDKAASDKPAAEQQSQAVGEATTPSPKDGAITNPDLIAVALGQSSNRTASTFAEQQKYFELVSSYRFYNIISRKLLESLIMSPSEFIALLIVCFAGMLGSFLKIVFEAHTSNRDPDFRDLIVPPILGLICSLVLYILLRAGFIAVTDHAEQTGSANLSPFVIAFVSLTAGLLSNRAVAVLERSSSTLLGGADTEDKSRWAVGLRQALNENQMTVEQLATRLRLLTKSVSDWVDEIEPVPSVNQREISLILNIPARALFTDLNP